MAEEPETTPLARPRPREVSVVAVGASLGGLAALSALLGRLPADFGAPLLIVQHLAPSSVSYFAAILGRRTALKVKDAEAGERIAAGTVYLGPPNVHLVLGCDQRIGLSDEPRVNFLRPSVDRLFCSVAEACGERAVAVVLTGSGADGSAGVCDIHRAGGLVIVQEVASAEYPGMPSAAMKTQAVDFSLPIEKIASTLIELVMK